MKRKERTTLFEIFLISVKIVLLVLTGERVDIEIEDKNKETFRLRGKSN